MTRGPFSPFFTVQLYKTVPTKLVLHFEHQLLHPLHDSTDAGNIESYGLQRDWDDFASE